VKRLILICILFGLPVVSLAETINGVPIERSTDAKTTAGKSSSKGWPFSSKKEEPAPVAQTAKASSDSVLDLYDQLNQLQSQVQSLQGIVERQSRDIEVLQQQAKDRYIELDKRLKGMNAGVSNGDSESAGESPVNANVAAVNNAADLSSVPGVPKIPLSAANPNTSSKDERKSYDLAYNAIKNKELSQAESLLNGFIQQYPKSSLIPNARYWLGDVYLFSTPPDYEKARINFMRVIDEYPSSSKVPASLYKLGVIHHQLGNTTRARGVLKRVITDYPGTTASRLAQTYLSEKL
jgi:tol-pal system protein YbgF